MNDRNNDHLCPWAYIAFGIWVVFLFLLIMEANK